MHLSHKLSPNPYHWHRRWLVTWLFATQLLLMLLHGHAYRSIYNMCQVCDAIACLQGLPCISEAWRWRFDATSGPAAAFTPDSLQEGHTFTIEPMINDGSYRDRTWPDGWTSVTEDGRRSAQFEHALLVTASGCEVLTHRTKMSPPLWWEAENVALDC
jgi:hypothetical protein